MPATPANVQYYISESCTNNSIDVVTYLNSNCQTPYSSATAYFDNMQSDENGCSITPAGLAYCAATINSTTVCPISTLYQRTECTIIAPSVNYNFQNSTSNVVCASSSVTPKQLQPTLILVAISLIFVIVVISFLFAIYLRLERLTSVVKTASTNSDGNIANPMTHRI